MKLPIWLHNRLLGIKKHGNSWTFPAEIVMLSAWNKDRFDYLMALTADQTYITVDGKRWNRL